MTVDPSDGIYEAMSRGAELFSLVPETTVLSWDKNSEQKAGFKQLNVTVKVRLDKQPDTVKYIVPEFKYCSLYLYLADNNGVFFGDGQFDATQMPLHLIPGLSLVDTNTEEAKFKQLLDSKPGTTSEITFVGIVQDSYTGNLADHVASCVLECKIPLYDKNPRRR
ncbi:MAG: hypothetical protein IJT97_04550 [Bacteroidaceae bacterium]|nr:hypothetical protein [Bacteroidaceae bacterium]